ncbi:hypothetical protein ABES33_05825 [Bacillus pseudomycoides]|uniref:hypothetical protein n=1 Tax=Bacillus pseudomycoides TaxID=64104 RepID=UPI003D19A424
MRIYAQQGYGKGDKLEKGIGNNSLDGIVLSPRDDREENLISLISEIREESPNIDLIADPQFYYSTYADGVSKNLDQLDYYPGNINLSHLRSFRNIQEYIQKCFDHQNTLNVHSLVSPTILIPNFSDRYAQIALTMAEESVNIANDMQKPVLISLIFQENALNEATNVNEFLNELSMLEAEGFYITVARNSTIYDQKFDEASSLANLLTMIYSLSEINEFKVVMGYSDIIGLLYLTVGAHAISTGWHNSSKKFTIQQRILPSTGGRLPRERYTSTPLLNSILASELDSIARQLTNRGMTLDLVLSEAAYDNVILSGANPTDGWTRAFSHLQHWSALKKAATELQGESGDICERLDLMQDKINKALTTYRMLEGMAIQFDSASSGKHLEIWNDALTQFRETHQI